jgi:hypothetical protein
MTVVTTARSCKAKSAEREHAITLRKLMAPLHNPRWERFAQALFEGKSADEAYETAGYSANRGNASRLKANENISTRLTELQLEAQKKSEVSVASLLEELEHARQRADNLNQLSASVKAISEKAKISGLLVQKIEVTEREDFSDCGNVPAILERLNTLIGPEATQAFCAYFGVDEGGGEVVKSGSFVPTRRKFGHGQYQQQLESIIRDAIPSSDDDVEILPEDITQLRGLIRQFDQLVSNVRARSARVVNAADPVDIERKRLFGPSGGNGRQR